MVRTYRVYAANGEYLNRLEARDQAEALHRAELIGGATVELEG